MDAVFNRIPMTDDEFEQFRVAALLFGVAGGVIGDFGFPGLLVFGLGQVNGHALDPFD